MSNDKEVLNPEPTERPLTPRLAETPSTTPSTEASKSSTKKTVVYVGLGVVLLIAGIWTMRVYRAHEAAAKKSAQTGPPVVSVILGPVVQKDVPIYLDGLGTVQAFNTVTVHVRVDGQVQKITFEEGQDVKAGDVLAQIDPDPFRTAMEQVEGKKAQDEAQLTNAQLDLKRDAQQISDKIIAQQAYDTQQALVNQLQATVKADQAAVDSAKVQLNYTTVVSPINGRTGIRQVDAGNIVHATDAGGLVSITQLKPISVIFTLPQQNLPEIQKHRAEGELSVVAVDRDNSTMLGQGKLAVIDNQIDPTTATLKFKSNFPNEDLRLWPGQFVNARLLLTTRRNGIVVPASVVQRGPDGSYAFVVVSSNQTVKVQPVKVAQIEAGEALIDSGLQAGEQVVVDGQYRLQNGSHIKAAEKKPEKKN